MKTGEIIEGFIGHISEMLGTEKNICLGVYGLCISLIFLPMSSQPAQAFCLYNCPPSEAVLKKLARQKIQKRASRSGDFNIVNIQIVKSFETKIYGADIYRANFQSLVIFPKGNKNYQQCLKTSNTCPPKGVWAEFANIKYYKPGHRHIFKDILEFRKTNKGWLGEDGRFY